MDVWSGARGVWFNIPEIEEIQNVKQVLKYDKIKTLDVRLNIVIFIKKKCFHVLHAELKNCYIFFVDKKKLIISRKYEFVSEPDY